MYTLVQVGAVTGSYLFDPPGIPGIGSHRTQLVTTNLCILVFIICKCWALLIVIVFMDWAGLSLRNLGNLESHLCTAPTGLECSGRGLSAFVITLFSCSSLVHAGPFSGAPHSFMLAPVSCSSLVHAGPSPPVLARVEVDANAGISDW